MGAVTVWCSRSVCHAVFRQPAPMAVDLCDLRQHRKIIPHLGGAQSHVLLPYALPKQQHTSHHEQALSLPQFLLSLELFWDRHKKGLLTISKAHDFPPSSWGVPSSIFHFLLLAASPCTALGLSASRYLSSKWHHGNLKVFILLSLIVCILGNGCLTQTCNNQIMWYHASFMLKKAYIWHLSE